MARNFTILTYDGFTLIELLVSVGVVALLTGIALFNWKAGSQNLALARAAGQVSQDIRQAEEFSLSGRPAACFSSAPQGSLLGYGIFFTALNPSTYLIFANCNAAAAYDQGADEVVETKALEQGIAVFSTAPSPLSIVFLPPLPEVRIEQGSASQGSIVLQNSERKQKTLQVNTRGVVDIF